MSSDKPTALRARLRRVPLAQLDRSDVLGMFDAGAIGPLIDALYADAEAQETASEKRRVVGLAGDLWERFPRA